MFAPLGLSKHLTIRQFIESAKRPKTKTPKPLSKTRVVFSLKHVHQPSHKYIKKLRFLDDFGVFGFNLSPFERILREFPKKKGGKQQFNYIHQKVPQYIIAFIEELRHFIYQELKTQSKTLTFVKKFQILSFLNKC